MLNEWQGIGNLGRDVECRFTQDNRKVVSFSIACSEKWKDKQTGEQKERTEWVNCVIFSEGLANIAEQYLRKGSKVYVRGKLQTRKWQDKDGNDRYSTEVVLQGFDAKLLMLDGKSDGRDGHNSGGHHGGGGDHSGNPAGGADLDDTIPFVSPYPTMKRGLV